jgi:hypothetical protein
MEWNGLLQQPPTWYSGQSSSLGIQKSRARFPALPDFLRSSGSGTGSTQPREDNWGATSMKSSGSGVENPRLTAVGTRSADHSSLLYHQMLVLTSPTSGGRTVAIIRLWAKIPGGRCSFVRLFLQCCSHGHGYNAQRRDWCHKRSVETGLRWEALGIVPAWSEDHRSHSMWEWFMQTLRKTHKSFLLVYILCKI